MNELAIKNLWAAEKPIYLAWGEYVTERIVKELLADADSRPLDELLKIPPKPRLKADVSLIDKALYRDKNYADPYRDIEDKVGVRFVVLLTKDIEVVETAIRACGFLVSKDKDFETERDKKPLEFPYQSVHFVVRSTKDVRFKGHKIPKGTPCEVQVRTLLQHAHSELTHDRIYKSKAEPPAKIKRTVAKSMALIEATDDFFGSVLSALDELDRPARELLESLTETYRNAVVGLAPEKAKLNVAIIDALQSVVGPKAAEEVSALLTERSFLGAGIARLAVTHHLFRQPAVLLAFLGADKAPSATREAWPFADEELRLIYNELGKNLEDY